MLLHLATGSVTYDLTLTGWLTAITRTVTHGMTQCQEPCSSMLLAVGTKWGMCGLPSFSSVYKTKPSYAGAEPCTASQAVALCIGTSA